MATPGIDAIRDAVHQRQSWAIDVLQQLIAIDSIAPHEKACQLALADLLRQEGLAVKLVPLDDGSLTRTDGYIYSGLPLTDRPNLVTGIGDCNGNGRSLVLNSHIDTVMWEHTLDKWELHPLSGAIADGKLYGRGSMDAKGQIMAAMVAILALKDLGFQPGGCVTVHSAVSEEPDGNGTLALCEHGYVADAAINLEATGNRIAYGHRGIIGLRYSLAGEVRHASVRGERENVIVQAGKLADALDRSLDNWSHPSDEVYGKPTINIGHIVGGDDIFTTPYGCTVDCGIRYAPNTYDAILTFAEQQMREQLAVHLPDLPSIRETQFLHVDASGISPRDPFVSAFQSAVRAVEDEVELVVFPGGCDVRHFINRYEMPAVIFGPGDLALAHGENEYLDLVEWERASQTLALFITQWCN